MTVTSEQLDRALEHLRDVVCRERGVAAEFEASRAEFFRRPASGNGDAQRLATRRHAEWFLLERPSATLGGVPIESLLHDTQRLESELERGLDEEAVRALLSSSCSVFEVTGVELGEGLWVRDLAARGEYALEEPEGSRALAKGDLLVGRLFDVGDSLHRLSPAAGVFRDSALSRALDADLERARQSRRGVVRLSQAELESMFWGAIDEPTGGDAVELARRFLAESGVAAPVVDGLMAELARTPLDESRLTFGAADGLGRVLDRLAFETGVDLERARRVLLAAWASLRERATAAAPAESSAQRGDVRSAMAAFDRGRSEGRDLEQLFQQLEHDLELDDESELGAEEPLAPDFPGVVGAVVDEFLWEVREEQGEAAAARYASLARFAEFGAQFGVFENLGARELLWFASVWLPEHGEFTTAEQASEALAALRDFCAWCERVHDVPLGALFEQHVAPVAQSLPRLVAANRLRERESNESGELFEWLGADRVRDRMGHELDVRLPRALNAHLEPGDRLRAERRGDGTLTVFCCYPPQSAQLGAELA